MTNPIISVIVPSYNHGMYIGKAIESVINQTYKNWEIIVVDNNSKDNTREVLDYYLTFNINLKVIDISNNGIIASSRNAGVFNSKGTWIAFLDSDDQWVENKLEKCINYIDDKIVLIYHDMLIYGTGKSYFNRKLKGLTYEYPVLNSLLTNGNRICNSSVLVRKSILIQIGYISTDIKMVASEDFNTWLKIAEISEGFKYLPLSLGLYNIHHNGVSRKDMSYSMFESTKEFRYRLSKQNLKRLDAHIKYAHCRFVQINSMENNIYKDLLFCIKYGNIEIIFKSIYILIIIIIYKIIGNSDK